MDFWTRVLQVEFLSLLVAGLFVAPLAMIVVVMVKLRGLKWPGVLPFITCTTWGALGIVMWEFGLTLLETAGWGGLAVTVLSGGCFAVAFWGQMKWRGKTEVVLSTCCAVAVLAAALTLPIPFLS